jgi:hypothetical protein
MPDGYLLRSMTDVSKRDCQPATKGRVKSSADALAAVLFPSLHSNCPGTPAERALSCCRSRHLACDDAEHRCPQITDEAALRAAACLS